MWARENVLINTSEQEYGIVREWRSSAGVSRQNSWPALYGEWHMVGCMANARWWGLNERRREWNERWWGLNERRRVWNE